MRELVHNMFKPQYSITNETLRSIAGSEYSRAIIENTVILSKWQHQLEDEARAETIAYSLQRSGMNIGYEKVKRFVRSLPGTPLPRVTTLSKAISLVNTLSKQKDISGNDIMAIYTVISGRSQYRNSFITGITPPDEILAEVSKLVDWYAGFDAGETHPIIRAGIFTARINEITPFDPEYMKIMSDLTAEMCLRSSNFEVKNYYSLSDYFLNTQRRYSESMDDVLENKDYTIWLEYFSEGIDTKLSNISEKIRIMAKDTKLAKAATDMQLTSRQEKIVEFLQNYGQMTNKDYAQLFPSISEDTVLREIKDLLNKGIIVKRGKTKSSRYVLK